MSKSTSRPAGTEPLPWIVPGTLVLIALLFRFLFYSQLKQTPFFANLYSDSRIYADIAASILNGNTSLAALFMSPLYPVFLAAVQCIAGDIAIGARITQIVIGTCSVLLVYLTGKRLFNRAAGYAAGLLAALFPAFIFYDNQILLESLLAFVIIAHLYALVRSMSTQSRMWPLLAGLVMGAGIALRGSTGLFLPFFALYLWRAKLSSISKAQFALLYSVGILVLIVPFTIRNSSLADEFVPLTTSFGLNLYAGNNPETNGTYTVPEAFDAYNDPSGSNFAERAVGRTLTPTEVSDFWENKALMWITANPGAFAALYAKKLLLFFHTGEIPQTGLSRAFIRKQYDTVLDFPLPPIALIFALAFAGIALTWRWRSSQMLALLYTGTYIASTALFFVNDRLRTPVATLLMLFAGYAVTAALEAVRRRSYVRAGTAYAGGILVVVIIGLFQPVLPQVFDTEYNRLGDSAFENERYSAAEKYFTLSVQESPSALNLTNLGNALAAQQKFTEAEHAFENAIRMDDTYHKAFFNKGNMAHQRGRPEVAFRYWSKAVELEPDFAPAYRNMGLLLMQAGKFERARTVLLHYIEIEPDPAKQKEIRRDIATIDDMLRRNNQTN